MPSIDWDPIEAEVALGVGAVAMESANLEYALYQLFCRLVGSPLAGIVAMGEGFSFYYERSRNLLRYRSDISLDDADHIWSLLEESKRQMEHRNHVIHGLWALTAPGGASQNHTVALTRRGYKTPVREYSPADMAELASSMSQLANQLHEDVLDIFDGQFLDWDDESRAPGVLTSPRQLPKKEP